MHAIDSTIPTFAAMQYDQGQEAALIFREPRSKGGRFGSVLIRYAHHTERRNGVVGNDGLYFFKLDK